MRGSPPAVGSKYTSPASVSKLIQLPPGEYCSRTISQLEEGYVYWRIATGGPGLPDGATPWNSSMPVWQDFLSNDEIWQVIAYIYQASGSTPRVSEEH